MEVLVGSTAYAMEMEVSSAAAAAYVRDRTGGGTGGVVVPSAAAAAVTDNNKKVVSGSCLFLKEEEIGSDDLSGSSSSSSIGSDDDDEEGKDADGEVSSSKLSLDSLEDSLPIKRGLSNHFSGKSKSFANLLDVSTVTDLKKQENPFNKRRRVLIANKWSRKSSSFYSWQNPKSMPLLTVHEDQDHRDRDDDNDDNPDRDHEHHHTVAELGTEEKNQTRVFGNRLQKKIGFKSQRSFSLADLHDDDEEEEHQ